MLDLDSFDAKDIIFSVKTFNKPVKHKRIMLNRRCKDGVSRPLVLCTEKLLSLGVKENNFGGKSTYSFPICMYDRDGATQNQKKLVDTFKNIVERCKDYLLENKEELEKPHLTREKLANLASCLWDGDKTSPILYAKINLNNGFQSKFYLQNTKLSLTDLINIGRCNALCAIRIESIFVGSSISLQVKIEEAEIETLKEKESKRLLR